MAGTHWLGGRRRGPEVQGLFCTNYETHTWAGMTEMTEVSSKPLTPSFLPSFLVEIPNTEQGLEIKVLPHGASINEKTSNTPSL